MTTRLKTRLRRRQVEEARPTPVFILYDSLVMTDDEALEAAYRSGKIPPNAAIFLAPEQIHDREVWERICKAEFAALERQRAEERQRLAEQQQREAGPESAESSTP